MISPPMSHKSSSLRPDLIFTCGALRRGHPATRNEPDWTCFWIPRMHTMRPVRILLLAVLTLATAAVAQTQPSYDVVPPAIDDLRQIAVSKTEFSLDHSMLVLASKLDSNDEALVRVIAGVSG